MRKFLVLILIIIFSSTWILYVITNDGDTKIKEDICQIFKFNNILFLNRKIDLIEKKHEIIIRDINYLPWGVKINWEPEVTLLEVDYDSIKFFYNQKLKEMKKFKSFDGTIKIEGTKNIQLIRTILEAFKDLNIKKIVFYKNYFEIYGNNFLLKFSNDNFKEKIETFKEIVKKMGIENKSLDFRFRIPFIGGI
uniref:FtsQ-type POTRA domain-containing protein n=1 Tax=Dictyoglomus thermophilum TaxID=14 RepID=A0A7C3MLE0_DICTH